jgi:6-phosphogluconolactonase (cycloisomerase 2 family)
MAQQVPLSSKSVWVSNRSGLWWLVLLQAALGATAVAQTPQQQYVYGSVPVTAVSSQVVAYTKNPLNGTLSGVAGAPFPDSLHGGAMAIDGLGRFLFVVNPNTSNISMLQINQTTGSLTEVPGSPFSTGPTQNPAMAPTSPVCIAAEKSGQFLYVGYRFGNIAGQGAINEYLIDPVNLQLLPLPRQPSSNIPSAPIGLLTDPRGLHLYTGLGPNPSTGVDDGGTNVYAIDPITGVLTPTGIAGNSTSAGRSIAMDPRGRFFFDGWGANVGTIESALISPADGTAVNGISSLTLANQIPVAMVADSSGKFLYVQQSLGPAVYTIDQTTGALTALSSALATFSFSPGSAAADPLGPFIYSLQQDGVHGFLIDPQTGALSEVPGSPFGGAVAQGTLAITGVPVQAVSGPVAALFPASIAFGSITVGQSSSSKLVTLTNTGDQALAVNTIGLTGANPSDFLATPNCSVPTVLSPNATCTVSVVFSPTVSGIRQASLSTSNNALGSPQSILLGGNGAAPAPAVALMPGSLSFASTTVGSSSPIQNITVTSSGSAPLHISSVLPSGANPADFQVSSACAGAYPSGSTCNIAVTFSPVGAGQRTAVLIINDDAPNSPQSLPLIGMATAAPPGTPVLKLTPNSVSFGTVTQGASAGAQVITLTSSGTGALHIAGVALGGTNATDFSLSNNCAAAAYAVGANCTIGVSLSSLTTGSRAAFIAITDDAPNSPQTIGLSASIAPALTISPAAPGSNAATVTAGQTATFTLRLIPGSGLAGSASFACAGAPTAAICTAPNVQISGGMPISYVVSVGTTKNSMVTVPPQSPPPLFIRLRVFSLASWGGILVLLLYMFRSRRQSLVRHLLCAASLAIVASACLLGTAGCGGGGTSATPQSVPLQHMTGTPQGTSIITLTPSVVTSSGTALAGIPPVQLTLTVQ